METIETLARAERWRGDSVPEHNAHVVDWYAAMVEVYAGAAAIGVSVGHIAEWNFERWWCTWVAGCEQVHSATTAG